MILKPSSQSHSFLQDLCQICRTGTLKRIICVKLLCKEMSQLFSQCLLYMVLLSVNTQYITVNLLITYTSSISYLHVMITCLCLHVDFPFSGSDLIISSPISFPSFFPNFLSRINTHLISKKSGNLSGEIRIGNTQEETLGKRTHEGLIRPSRN